MPGAKFEFLSWEERAENEPVWTSMSAVAKKRFWVPEENSSLKQMTGQLGCRIIIQPRNSVLRKWSPTVRERERERKTKEPTNPDPADSLFLTQQKYLPLVMIWKKNSLYHEAGFAILLAACLPWFCFLIPLVPDGTPSIKLNSHSFPGAQMFFTEPLELNIFTDFPMERWRLRKPTQPPSPIKSAIPSSRTFNHHASSEDCSSKAHFIFLLKMWGMSGGFILSFSFFLSNNWSFQIGIALAQESPLIKMHLAYLVETVQFSLFAWTMCRLGILNSFHARHTTENVS